MHLTGEHDLATLPELAKLLAAAVVLDDADWVLDLRRVTFMDLLSVRLLSQTRVLFHQQSRALRLQAPTPSVQHTFDLLGVDGLLGPGWRRTTTRAAAMDLRRRTRG